MKGRQVLSHKLSTTDNPSNWEMVWTSMCTTPFSSGLLKKCFENDLMLDQVFEVEYDTCELNGRGTWRWIKHSHCIQ